MGEAVEQRRRHLRVAEHRRPFAEAQIGRDDDAGALVELAEQMEEQRAAGGAERQVAKLVEDDEIGMGEPAGELPWLALVLFLFEGVDEFDGKRRTGRVYGDARRPGRRWRWRGGFCLLSLSKGPGPPTRTTLCASSRNSHRWSWRTSASLTWLEAKSKPARSR